MDVFRSATLAIAVIILIFMGMIMYYEFKVNSSKVKFPPYNSKCPDYSYEYNYGTDNTVDVGCKFNDSFVENYKKLNNTFSLPNGTPLCPGLLKCSTIDGEWIDCMYSSETETPPIPKEMKYVINKNNNLNKQNIKKCHLTLDGIV